MKNTTLIFTGDIGFDKYMDHRWEDDELISDEIMEYLHSGDHLIINVEGPLSKQEKIIKENGFTALTHSMDPAVAGFFDRLSADIWNINNNHIMDVGEKGMKDTLQIAGEHGVKTLGAGMNLDEAKAPVYLDEAGGIGIIAVGYERACRIAGEDSPGCLNFSRMDIVREQIELVKKTCRWCIVVAHDGEEFTALPMPYTRERYLSYLDMGADIVVAHHPHVPMNYELVNSESANAGSTNSGSVNSGSVNSGFANSDSVNSGEKAIFYSLGNFIFDTDYQRSQFNTESGLFLKIKLSEEKFTFEPYGIRIDRETGRIIPWSVPEIFEDVNEEEYEKLLPLAAKMFVENTKRQLKYLKPAVFNEASEEQFRDNFYEPLRSGRVPGKVLDFQIVYPLSLDFEKGEWKNSRLEAVKQFMLKQIEPEN